MSDQNEIPSPLQMLAKVNEALESSGLKQYKTEREPLPLFRQLLTDWLVSQGFSEAETGVAAGLETLLCRLPEGSVREALQRLQREALQLSRAHQRLNDWNQRELENEYNRLVKEVAQRRLADASGY